MTECQILPFRPKPRPVEMTHHETAMHYARWINSIIRALEEAGFGPALDRVAGTEHTTCAAQTTDTAKASIPPARKRPLLFAVPNFGPPRKRARKAKSSGAPRMSEPPMTRPFRAAGEPPPAKPPTFPMPGVYPPPRGKPKSTG
jgi:hypothetical protein